MKREVKIAIFGITTIALAIGGYFAYKHFFNKGVVTATSKKDRNVVINNKK